MTTLALLFHGDRSTNLFNIKPAMCVSKALAMMPDPGFPMGRIICDNKIVSLSSCNYLSVLTALTSGSPQLLSQLRFLPRCRKLSTCSKEHSLFAIFWELKTEAIGEHTTWYYTLYEPLIFRWCGLSFA